MRKGTFTVLAGLPVIMSVKKRTVSQSGSHTTLAIPAVVYGMDASVPFLADFSHWDT